jgi:hypothetical protein
MKVYQVNLHHRGGFIRQHAVTAANLAAAKVAGEELIRSKYPAKVIAKIVVFPK